MFLQDAEHGVVQRQVEDRRLDLGVEEAAGVELLQDVSWKSLRKKFANLLAWEPMLT